MRICFSRTRSAAPNYLALPKEDLPALAERCSWSRGSRHNDRESPSPPARRPKAAGGTYGHPSGDALGGHLGSKPLPTMGKASRRPLPNLRIAPARALRRESRRAATSTTSEICFRCPSHPNTHWAKSRGGATLMSAPATRGGVWAIRAFAMPQPTCSLSIWARIAGRYRAPATALAGTAWVMRMRSSDVNLTSSAPSASLS